MPEANSCRPHEDETVRQEANAQDSEGNRKQDIHDGADRAFATVEQESEIEPNGRKFGEKTDDN